MKPHLHELKSPVPWNKGRLIGQKAPLKLKEIWAIRIRLQLPVVTGSRCHAPLVTGEWS
jgi:hypothetical protein